jgi:GTPase SAR1 family protein
MPLTCCQMQKQVRYFGSSIEKCRLYHEYSELHRLLEDTELASTALLVVSNKIDLDPHATEQQLIRGERMTEDKYIGRYVYLLW